MTKGKIDVTMDVEIHDRTGAHKLQISTPFELKTGKVSYSFAHQSQILLYALMLDNPLNPCKFGLLAYLKNDVNIKYITINDCIKHGLIMQRNELVYFLKHLENSPETRSNVSFCSKCEHVFDCCLMGKVYEPEKLVNFNTFQPDLVPDTLAHLDREEIEFFKNWIDMIYIEEKKTKYNSKSPFWNNDAIELEKKEKAIAKLVLHSIKDADSFEYVFKRSPNFKSLSVLPIDLQFYKSSDRITLSIENENGEFEKIGFVNGAIKSIDENCVNVQLDDRINDKFLNKLFRLDIVPAMQSHAHMYSAILRLMANERNSAYLRDLIIKKRAPTFNQRLSESQFIDKISKDLNSCQRESMLKSLEMDDYLLIKGMIFS